MVGEGRILCISLTYVFIKHSKGKLFSESLKCHKVEMRAANESPTIEKTRRRKKHILCGSFVYVALWDPESTKFQYYLWPSPRDWRTLIHFNVVLTVFHIDHISQGVCKTVRTPFQCLVVLQLRGKGPENLSRICPIVMCLFRTFSPQL